MANLVALVKELREKTGVGLADCKKALEATECDIDKAVDWLREKGIAKSASKASRIAAEGLAKVVVAGNTAVIVEVNSETDFSAKNEKFQTLVNTIANAILENKPATVEEALAMNTAEGPLSEVIAQVSFATGEKMTLRRFEVIEKTDSQVFGVYVHHDGKKGCVAVLEGDKEDVAKNIAMQIVSMNPSYVSKETMPQDIVDHETEVQTTIVKNDPSNENRKPEIIEKMIAGKVDKALKDMCLVEQDYILDGKSKVKAVLANNGMSCVSFVRYGVGDGIEKKKDNWVEEVAASLKK